MLDLSQFTTLANKRKLDTGEDYVIIQTGKTSKCLDIMKLKDYNKLSSNIRYTVVYSTKSN